MNGATGHRRILRRRPMHVRRVHIGVHDPQVAVGDVHRRGRGRDQVRPGVPVVHQRLDRDVGSKKDRCPSHGAPIDLLPIGRFRRAATCRRPAAPSLQQFADFGGIHLVDPRPQIAAAAAFELSPSPVAMAAMVPCSNSTRIGNATPNASCTRAMIRVASSECPPRSKKTSCRPMRSRPRTLAPDLCESRLDVVAGGAYCAAGAASVWTRIRGSAPWSTLPFGVSGSASSATTAGRQHVVGQTPAQERPQIGQARRTVRAASRRRPAAGRCRRRQPATTAWRTDGCAHTAASISPGSMRKPRIFTCWSRRPRNSSVPSGQPARAVAGAIHAPARAADRTDRRRSAPP